MADLVLNAPPLPAESPFFSGSNLQFAWDSTSLGLLKECPRKYQLTILEGWRAKSESVHLKFGILFHKALELYDKFRAQGLDYEEAVDETLAWLLEATWERGEDFSRPWTSDHDKKNRDTLVRSIIWYLDQYKDDVAKTLILENGDPAVELSFKFDAGFGDFILCGHMDRLVTFSDDVFVMDRKTSGSTLSTYYFNQFNPDNQMTLYTLAGKIVYNLPIQGVMIDAAQIAIGFTAFSRGITMRSDGQLNEWLGDFKQWTNIARLHADEGHWPMNEKSCSAYGGCVFRGICSLDPAVRESYLKTYFEKRFWNPLSIR